MKTIEEVYSGITYEEAETALRAVGSLTEIARRNGKSLSLLDREFIWKARRAAGRLGMSDCVRNATEMEGAELVRQAVLQ